MSTIFELLDAIPEEAVPEEGRDVGPPHTGGNTSFVYFSSDQQYVFKHVCVDQFLKYDCAKREAQIMKTALAGAPWAPELVYATSELLVLNYCGEQVTTDTLPEDFLEQAEDILVGLQERGVKHNDIKAKEVLVKDDRLYLCDYGWASVNGDFSIGRSDICAEEKPCGILSDRNSLLMGLLNIEKGVSW